MIKRFIMLAAIGSSLAGPAFAQDAGKDVEAAYAAWDAAFNKGDPAALSQAYAEGALFLAPDHVVRKGPDDVEAFFGGLFENGVTGHRLTLVEAHGEGDLVYAAANWKAQAKGENGAATQVGGVGTHIFERQDDGSLKLVLHTFN